MKLEIVPQNDFIIRYGEVGTKFYIIIRGDVSIYIPTKLQQEMNDLQFYEFVTQNQM